MRFLRLAFPRPIPAAILAASLATTLLGTAAALGPLSGATTSTSPVPTYSVPGEWTEPGRLVALPRGVRADDHGNDVGFPHTTEGAAAMLAASNSASVEHGRSMVDEQLGLYDSYMAQADRTPQNEEKVKAQAAATDADLRREMGIRAGDAMPSGAYARTHVIAFKTITSFPDEVSVYLLSRITLKAGETKPVRGSYTRSVLAAQWQAGDWKLSPSATTRATHHIRGQRLPAMAAPGDAAFNAAGWTAIRKAS